MSNDIEAVLAERGRRYGTFAANSALSQQLKDVVRCALGEQGKALPVYQMEALEMILHKIARIVNGDCMYEDNLFDIIGYAQLALNETRSANQMGASVRLADVSGLAKHAQALQQPK